ncbi:hypothetical protein BDV96DRAFT_600172 [Lophiotrema nucula]|uniref:Heterokaryon incompatibility domain-containing protein n=1 Tax=Lophiotrema nucula TaxID=690887 RepID=A0A6A5Z6D5_9PLEO|nr:hypothetical protein BDV96DRAFT_600172 [Lophiotrema nucula]
MASIYSMADAVLVLDFDLMQLKPETIGLQMLARLVCCTWNTRSWTLHESALANRSIVRFADRVLLVRRTARGSMAMFLHGCNSNGTGTEMYDVMDGSYTDWDDVSDLANNGALSQGQSSQEALTTPLYAKIHAELTAHLKEILVHSRLPNLDAERFISLWNALAGRSTTMQDDLYHILANILDINSQPLSARELRREASLHLHEL